MNETIAWADTYYKWLRDNTVTNTLSNGWTEIATPFLDRHNDGLVVYVKKDGDSITISDDGYIINDLISSGLSLSGKSRRQILNNFLTGYGVENIDNELVITATMDNFPIRKHMLIQAMLAVNDMFILNSDNTKSIFLEDVSNFLYEEDIPSTPNISMTGKSGFDYKIDFVIPASRKRQKPERMIKVYNTPREDSIRTALFIWNDIKVTRKDETQLIVFLNDEKTVDKKLLSALDGYSASYILWSKRMENIDKLA